jgi:hypothetical protein
VVNKCGCMHREFFNKSASLHFSGLKTFANEVRLCSFQFSCIVYLLTRMFSGSQLPLHNYFTSCEQNKMNE